ncbi:MAG: insulinase family protein [Oligoflexia bacterium]|nr:insulinase family protein [Oligoflexia bacterium]
MKITEHLFKNQLPSVFINAPGTNLSCVQLWFKAGSALETPREYGVAHFLEHMFFKSKTDSGKNIVREVESYGGDINAFTSFDYTCYYINAPKDHLPTSIDLLLRMVAKPLLHNKDILPESEVVYEEFLRSIDHPGQFAFQRLQQLCFNPPYDHQILGTERNIKNFSATLLKNFKNKFYNAHNAFLVVAGDIPDAKKLFPIVEKYSFKGGQESSFAAFIPKEKGGIDIHQKDVNMANLTLAVKGLPYDHPMIGGDELSLNCFGFGETSRLYSELVHKTSLANNAYTSTMYLKSGGIIIVKVSAPADHLPKIYDLLLQIVSGTISDRPFSKEEVNKIKNQYIASKVYEKESLEAFAFALGNSYVQLGDIHGEQIFLDKIKNCSVIQVNECFKQIFTRPLFAVLQIPKSANLVEHKKHLTAFYNQFCKDIPATIKRKNEVAKIQKKQLKRSKFDSSLTVASLIPGIKLIHKQNKLTPTFVMHTYFKGGLAYEDDRNNGHHHLISELICKGHSNISYHQFQKELEERSASLGGVCGKNAYGLTLHGQTKDLDDLCKHYFGALLNSNFHARELAHEKQMIFRLFESQKKDPVRQCFKLVNASLFQNHPYIREIEGTVKTVKNTSREMLINLHQHNLKKQEMLITYCGDQDFESIVKFILPEIKSLPARKHEHLTFPMQAAFGAKQYLEFDREQSQIFLGLPTFPMTNKGDLYLKILTAFLSGQSSDLFTRMRDDLGLCYSVSPIHFSALSGGYFGIYMASSTDKGETAIKELRGLINKLRDKGLTAANFKRTLEILNGQLKVAMQTNDDYATVYSIPELHDLGVDFVYNNNKRINEISVSEFNRFLKTFFEKELNSFVVGRKNFLD